MKNQEIISSLGQTRDSFYLYDQKAILDRVRTLKEDFPGVSFLYSIKCNPHPQVLKTGRGPMRSSTTRGPTSRSMRPSTGSGTGSWTRGMRSTGICTRRTW